VAERAIFKFITSAGELDAASTGSIDDLKERLKSPGTKVLLYLHGGLVSQKAGMAIADKLSAKAGTSLALDDDWIQIYIIWRTGVLEELKENWIELAENDKLYQSLVRKLIVFLAQRLHIPLKEGRAIADVVPIDEQDILDRVRGESGDPKRPFKELEALLPDPLDETARATLEPEKSEEQLRNEFEDYLSEDPLFLSATDDLDAALALDEGARGGALTGSEAEGAQILSRLDKDASLELIAPASAAKAQGLGRGAFSITATLVTKAGAVALHCIKRFRNHRDHGLHATIVEEVCRTFYADKIGAAVWGWMGEDAARHFTGKGFGLELVSAFSANPPSKLVIIGHSAGSIWASKMLASIVKSASPINLDLCLLAPAARSDLFAKTIAAAGGHIRHCSMFTMDDGLERADAVLGHDKGFIYPSSLLYLVSGLFERDKSEAYVDAPILGMQRFAEGDWLTEEEADNAKAIADFFKKSGHRICYSKESGLTDADTHGGFDDNALTLKSVHEQFFKP